ncbi:hypothetical protein [Siphonobacter curvatus]|nr:hypothetical protein [Siphonobacter curvatus]
MLNGTRVNMGSTGLRVTRENWDFRLRRYKGRDAISLANNAQLDGIES